MAIASRRWLRRPVNVAGEGGGSDPMPAPVTNRTPLRGFAFPPREATNSMTGGIF